MEIKARGIGWRVGVGGGLLINSRKWWGLQIQARVADWKMLAITSFVFFFISKSNLFSVVKNGLSGVLVLDDYASM